MFKLEKSKDALIQLKHHSLNAATDVINIQSPSIDKASINTAKLPLRGDKESVLVIPDESPLLLRSLLSSSGIKEELERKITNRARLDEIESLLARLSPETYHYEYLHVCWLRVIRSPRHDFEKREITNLFMKYDFYSFRVLNSLLFDIIDEIECSTYLFDLLVGYGASIDSKNLNNESLLMRAVLRKHKEIFDYLMVNKVPLLELDDNGKDVFYHSVIADNYRWFESHFKTMSSEEENRHKSLRILDLATNKKPIMKD